MPIDTQVAGKIRSVNPASGEVLGEIECASDNEVLAAVQRWADDDLRSLNGQIEFLLRRAISENGRDKDAQKKKGKV